MRLSIFPLVLAAAGVAQYATASPVRVIVFSGHSDAVPTAVAGPGANIAAPGMNVVAPTFASASPHFCNKLKNKALEITNKFRATFGLPTIESTPGPVLIHAAPIAPHAPGPVPSHEMVRILPIGKPYPEETNVYAPTIPIFAPMKDIPHPRKGPLRVGCHGSFIRRLHRALTILGPWEGRAVAFVLGCGIGVLLRMFWVIAILVARSLRGRSNSEEEDVQHILVFERDAEEISVAPPRYTDEKAPLPIVEAEKKETTA